MIGKLNCIQYKQSSPIILSPYRNHTYKSLSGRADKNEITFFNICNICCTISVVYHKNDFEWVLSISGIIKMILFLSLTRCHDISFHAQFSNILTKWVLYNFCPKFYLYSHNHTDCTFFQILRSTSYHWLYVSTTPIVCFLDCLW